jgi:arginyl-tRNA synthetase
MTQDIGTAIQRVKIIRMEWCIRLENRITILKCCFNLEKLGFDWSKNLFHLSYGMVDLPSGKMKSREGTVVDDDLMQEMTDTAQKISEDLGKLDSILQRKNQNYTVQLV